MAITIDTSNIVVNLDSYVGTITDGSTYTSPIRSAVGVFVKVYKVDYNSSRTALATTGNNSDPETDTVWEFIFTTDGWYKVAYVAPEDYNAGTTYSQYDVAFDDSTDYVYRSKVAGNLGNALSSTAHWERILEPTDLAFNIGTATESLNLNAQVYNVILYPITQVNFGTKTGEAFLEASSDYRRSQDVRVYELLNIAVNAMNIADDRAEYAKGEKYARRAISLCSNC